VSERAPQHRIEWVAFWRDRMLMLAMGVLTGVAVLSTVWEFLLEDAVLAAFSLHHETEPVAERWEFVITSVIFAGLALVVPTALLSIGLRRQEELTRDVERESQMLQTTLETIDRGICVFDADLNLAAWNDKYIELARQPRHLVTRGRPASDLIRYLASTGLFGPGDVDVITRDREQYFFKRGKRSHEIRRRSDGRILEVERIPMRDGGSVSIFTDITERMRNEDALREAMEEAESANRAKNQILANISHELRTPLDAIIGLSDIMKGGRLGPMGDPRYQEYTDDINDAARHLLVVIDDLLDVSRIEAGTLLMNEQIIDMAQLVRSSERLFREAARRQGVTLEVELPARLPHLFGDPVRTRQILINLMSNAIKFTDNGGWVTVSASLARNGRLVMAVADTGIGIPKDALEDVVAPFYRAEQTLTRDHEGTGLGLHLAKSLAEMHQGTLEIESEVGEGTTVTIMFPPARVVSLDPEVPKVASADTAD